MESDALQVASAEAEADRLRQRLPELRIGLVHGQQRADDRDATMTAFAAGEMDVLVATTVIEVGIDVPERKRDGHRGRRALRPGAAPPAARPGRSRACIGPSASCSRTPPTSWRSTARGRARVAGRLRDRRGGPPAAGRREPARHAPVRPASAARWPRCSSRATCAWPSGRATWPTASSRRTRALAERPGLARTPGGVHRPRGGRGRAPDARHRRDSPRHPADGAARPRHPTDHRPRQGDAVRDPGRAVPDARLLDLYAGSGAIGIEALSRGSGARRLRREATRRARRHQREPRAHAAWRPQRRVHGRTSSAYLAIGRPMARGTSSCSIRRTRSVLSSRRFAPWCRSLGPPAHRSWSSTSGAPSCPRSRASSRRASGGSARRCSPSGSWRQHDARGGLPRLVRPDDQRASRRCRAAPPRSSIGS